MVWTAAGSRNHNSTERSNHNSIQAELLRVRALQTCSRKLGELCETLLRRSWKDEITKRRYTLKDVGQFVRLSVTRSPQPLQRCHSLIDSALLALCRQIEDDMEGRANKSEEEKNQIVCTDYPTLSLSSFVLFFSPIFSFITESWQATFFSSEATMLLKFFTKSGNRNQYKRHIEDDNDW